MPNSSAIAQAYDGGVIAVDSGYNRPNMAACYLVEADTEVAIVETGTNDSVPRLLRALAERDWQPEDVRYVIVTHVHLDHAGGAGSLMAACPNATFLVHPRGARHMIDPSRLEASVRQVYGDEVFDRDYGTLVPIPEERTRVMENGDTADLDGRSLVFVDTPGHARHHFCIWDEATRGWFTGDTFGLSYRELDTDRGPFIFPTTTPIQFDPGALKASIEHLMERSPACMYLTHFGRVEDTPRLAGELLERVDELVAIAEYYSDAEHRGKVIAAAMLDGLEDAAREHGVTLSSEAFRAVVDNDVQLNTQGLEFWLDHRTGRE
jgi:glyoxylase-like metal-dependent hydrolase (beta-lactamase superfamily II)